MNKRVFLVGAGGGALVSAAGWIPLRVFLPKTVLPNWMPERSASFQEALGWAAGMAVLLLLTGFMAGRMSGARSRLGAMGAGAIAGWLAACIAEALFGGPAAGVLGARNLLAHGLVPAQTQEQFTFLIAESVLSIVALIYVSVFISMLLGLLLGGLGGLLAGRRGQAAAPEPKFWLSLVTVSLTVAAWHLVVMSSTYLLLAQTVQGAIEKISAPMTYPASILFALPVGLSLLWLLFWQIVAWRVLQAMPAATERTAIQSVIFTVLGALVAIPLLLPLLYGLFGIFDISEVLSPSWLTAVFWLSLILLALVIAHFLKRRVPEKVRVFLGRQGEARLLAVYFAVLSLLTLFLTIWVVNGGLGQNLWLLAGLVLGLGLAFLGLRAAWKSIPPEQETPLTGREVFARSALSLLFSNLFVVLNVLAPLAQVLITIVMIASLLSENPSTPQNVQSVEEIVLTYFNVTFSSALNLIILLPPAAGGVALLLWTFWRWLNRRGEAESPMEQV